jgi:hypothetical protein
MTRTYPGLSPRAVEYCLKLAADRAFPELGTCGEERLENLGALLENGMRWPQLSTLIDRLKQSPMDSSELVGPGVYRRDDLEIFVVKWNRAGTNVYAKRLVEVAGERLNEDDERVKVDFTYDPEALRTLRPDHHMTLEQARPFLIRYTNCMVCGITLKAALSVERSIGPVCVKMFLGAEPGPEPLPEGTEDALTDLLAALEGP